jgi:low temperature requirement protein LtrA
MHGMKGQEDWSVPAATAAFLGMSIAFVLWWWYFDTAAAAADWPVRSHRDAVAFHVWSYAHLPLYLGIAVAFAGIERIVHDGAADVLHGADGIISSVALGVAMLSLALIEGSRARSPKHRHLRWHVALAVLAGAVGVASGRVPAVILVIGLASLCFVQLSVAVAGARASRTQTI